MLINDMIGNPAKYTQSDADYLLNNGDTANDLTDLPIGSLCWDTVNSKMYVIKVADLDITDGVLNDADDAEVVLGGDEAEYVIGRLPNSWFNAMDSGKYMPVNFNLVNDMGDSLIPTTGNLGAYKYSKKFNNLLLWLSIDSVKDWQIVGDPANFSSSVSNSHNGTSIDTKPNRITFLSYQAYTKTTTQTTPKKTIAVSNKMIAASSHSVYQGAMLSNAITGKVSVADVIRGFESKTILDTMYNSNGELISQPSHNPLSLSISDSPASKLYTSLEVDDNGEILLAVTGEELINDLTSEGDIDGTDGTVDLISNRIYKVTVGNHTGRYIATSKAFTEIKLDDYTLGSDGKFRDLNNTVLDGLVEYLGSGFGDTGEFEQLTNGTTEDLNGNVVRTYHGSVRIGYYIGDE